MRPSRIKDKFSRVFSKVSNTSENTKYKNTKIQTLKIQNTNFENTSENLSLILRGLNAITCL